MSDWFYYTVRGLVNLTYTLLNLKVKIEGKFPEEPTLLTINHHHKTRFWFFGWHEKWDDQWLLSFIPTKRKIHFAVQDKQYMKPVTRFFLERLETFSAKEIRKGILYLKQGETVAIFPQGEAHLIQKDNYYGGAAFMAEKADVYITPIKIQGSREQYIKILPKINAKGLEQIMQELQHIYSE